MAGSSFGDLFKITTFGESHGEAIGVVIEGCPSGVVWDSAFIQTALDRRRPGQNPYVTPRVEKDLIEVLSGVYQGYTTGAPIAMIIKNTGADSAPYQALKAIYRPGHANFTYLEKFGHFDPRGGGRASARETATRVAAGAVADLILKEEGIEVEAYLTQVGPLICDTWDQEHSCIFCPDRQMELKIKQKLFELESAGDSVGGVVTGIIKQLPTGLGEPIFDRFEAKLALAMLSIPATKGFEIGEGFNSATYLGSEFNDSFCLKEGRVGFSSNHAGGTLGGITTGQELFFKVPFKPTSSIKKSQTTLNLAHESVEFRLNPDAKHDPCVAIRGSRVVKAMASLVTVDFILKKRLNRLHATCH